MADPVVFISRNRIREGKAAEFRRHYAESVASTMAAKTRTLAQLMYEDQTAIEVTVVRVFPDADALDLQLQGADQRSRKTYELIEPLSVEIYGAPNAATVERMQKIAGAGIRVSISPTYLGGFIR